MRKQDKIILWPAYFDSTRTRKFGRRVPKNLAVASPKILEIKDAVEKIGLDYEFVAEAGYSKSPWVKTGMLLVENEKTKEQTIRKIAKQLLMIRTAAATK